MTLSDLECLKSTSSASRAISAVAELLVFYCSVIRCRLWTSLAVDTQHLLRTLLSV